MSRRIVTSIQFIGRDENTYKEVHDFISSPFKDIDFNNIIQIPTSLNIQSNTYTEYGLAYYKYITGDIEDFENLYFKTKYENIDDYVKSLLKRYVDLYTLGERAFNNLLLYGYKTWREFVISEWGLPDLSYSDYGTITTSCTSKVSTNLRTPYKIIKKLSILYPNDTIDVKYSSDVIGIYCKHYHIQNGIIIQRFKHTDWRKIYCDLFNLNPNAFIDMKRDYLIDEVLE